MSSTHSDGRFHRARKAMRKLASLGFTEQELLELYRGIKEPQQEPIESGDDSALERHEQRALAQSAIRTLVALGFAECDIASMADVGSTTVTRTLDPTSTRVPKAESVQRLLKAVETAGAERLAALLPRVQVTVLETCCDKGTEVNPTPDSVLNEHVRKVFVSMLLGRPVQAPVAPGVQAAISLWGPPDSGCIVINAPRPKGETPDTRLAQIKALEHELLHMVERVVTERKALEKDINISQTGRLPSGGRIA